MNPARFGSCTRPTETSSSLVLVQQFRRRSSHESSSSATVPATSRPSRGGAKVLLRVMRVASRLKSVRTSASRVATCSLLVRSSALRREENIPQSSSCTVPDHRTGITFFPSRASSSRRGIAVLGYDKRGVGGSTGDWNTALFEDLAGDVVSAFGYLKTRSDIDATQIGLLGVSQAGWIMPLAAVRAKDLAFVISISGAGVPPADTTIDQARNELTARGMKPETVADIVAIMKLQYQFARTGQGWDEFTQPPVKSSRLGSDDRPTLCQERTDHPYWQSIRRFYFYDPAPTLRQLKGTGAGTVWGIGQQHPAGEEQRGLGGGVESRWPPGLYATDSRSSESLSVGSDDRKQRGDGVAATVCAGLFHHHPGMACETHPRLRRAAPVVPWPIAAAMLLLHLQRRCGLIGDSQGHCHASVSTFRRAP